MRDSILEFTGFDIYDKSEEAEIRAAAKKLHEYCRR